MNEPKDPFTAAEAWLQRMLDPKIFHPFRKKRDDSPYPSFNDRLSAMLIDGVWAFFLLGPVIQAIHPLVYGTLADAPPTHATDFGDFYRQMLRSGQLQKLMIENGITYAPHRSDRRRHVELCLRHAGQMAASHAYPARARSCQADDDAMVAALSRLSAVRSGFPVDPVRSEAPRLAGSPSAHRGGQGRSLADQG